MKDNINFFFSMIFDSQMRQIYFNKFSAYINGCKVSFDQIVGLYVCT